MTTLATGTTLNWRSQDPETEVEISGDDLHVWLCDTQKCNE